MKKLRVMVLMHEDLVPPEDIDDINDVPDKEFQEWETEWDVTTNLEEMGHHVLKLGVRDELAPIRNAITDWKPHIAFNLLEEFHGDALFDQHVVSYLELMRTAYTGCNPRGLILSRDKALSKKILAYHRIPVPSFAVFPRGHKVRRPRRLGFPLIVKSLIEEASLGIAQASVVDTDDKLVERVHFIHERIETDAIAEQFIDGREIYVGVMGNQRLQVLPPWEMVFARMNPDAPRIATAKVKWDREYQKRYGITTKRAKLSAEIEHHFTRLTKRIYRALSLSGYARMDYRLQADGQIYLLEANPNPNIADYEDFAESAKVAGLPYPQLLQRLMGIGLRVSH